MSSDITAVVNLHREGDAAVPSLVSADRSVRDAQRSGLSCTLMLVVDRPDSLTESLADHWESSYGARVVRTDEGDLGSSRNAATLAADSTWLAFLDADDLWGEYWLRLAHAFATANHLSEPTIWHPAVNVIFGDHHSLLHHVDSNDASFSWSRFRLHNQWTALSFVRRSDLHDVPFPRNRLADGFGFEDWSWNEEILRRGGHHRIVPETCHFIYRSANRSLLSQSQDALRTRYPSDAHQNYVTRPAIDVASALPHDALEETHVLAEVALDETMVEQVRRASAIDPRVLETVKAQPRGAAIPQNFQTHRSRAHRALDDLEVLRQNSSDETPIAHLLESSTRLASLPAKQRSTVVAEVLLDPELEDRPWGESPLISEALEVYPQLARSSR